MPPILDAFATEFRRYKRYGEQALQQVDGAGLHVQLSPRQNSIAVIVQHLHGNMRSRFTDFLTTDGEMPTRDRDAEFVDRQLARVELMALWETGWQCVFDALAPLTDADIQRIITIRGEPHTVALALARQLAHYAWHMGQIALLAKHLVGEKWNYLTIPPGGSVAFNEQLAARRVGPTDSR